MTTRIAQGRLMNVAEAAAYLEISVRQVYRLVHAHRLPVVQLGPHCLRIDRETLDRWIDDVTSPA